MKASWAGGGGGGGRGLLLTADVSFTHTNCNGAEGKEGRSTLLPPRPKRRSCFLIMPFLSSWKRKERWSRACEFLKRPPGQQRLLLFLEGGTRTIA